MYTHSVDIVDAFLGMQVDETLYAGTKNFIELGSEKALKFPSKGRTAIGSKKIRCNGIDIYRDGQDVFIGQKNYLKSIPKSQFKSD